MGRVGLGDDQKARRILIETVDDARTFDAADAGEAYAAVGDKRVDERAGGVPRRRMHDQPRRLVDDDHVFVFVDDRKGNIFALRRAFLGLRNGDLVAIAGPGLAPGFEYRLTAEPHLAGGDQALQLRPAEIGKPAGQPEVETNAGLVRRHLGGSPLYRCAIPHCMHASRHQDFRLPATQGFADRRIGQAR